MKFNKEKFNLNKEFIFKNNQIFLTEAGKAKVKKKKITGSRIGAIFGVDSFKTPFQAWCDMLGMYTEESDRFFLDAGQVIEPKLKAHAELKTGKKFKSYDPISIKFDVFQDNQIFGGIPDGEEYDAYGNIVSILEIKTAQLDKYKGKFKDNQFVLDKEEGENPQVKQRGGGLAKGFKNGEVMIPKSYQYQLALYLYLRNIEKGYFCVGFIKHKDYLEPNKVTFTSEFNKYQNYDIDSTVSIPGDEHLLIGHEFRINRDEFQKNIDYAEKGYKEHILNGVSPKMTTEDLTGFRYGYPELI